MNALILEKKDSLSDDQKSEVNAFMAVCREGGDKGVPYPVDDEDCMHYLLYDGSGKDNRKLKGALCVLPLSDDSAECIAYVHPDARRRGYFSGELLPAASEDFGDLEFIFPVRGADNAVVAVLGSIGADYDRTEYMMELDLETYTGSGLPYDSSCFYTEGLHPMESHPAKADLSDSYPYTGMPVTGNPAINYVYPPGINSGDDDTVWNAAAGRCRLEKISPDSVCLYGVEVRPEERRKGFGTAMILSLADYLKTRGIKRVVVHVSKGNNPAAALYEKTGFRISETLSYYVF